MLLTGFAGTRLKMELDRVLLWHNNHVAVKQLAKDFAPTFIFVASRIRRCWLAQSVKVTGR